jgi:DNA repair exonuclease SbcCD ATPase subunit
VSPTPMYSEPPAQRSPLAVALVAGALIALLAAVAYLFIQLDHVKADLAKTRESLMTEVSNLRDASQATTSSQIKHIETLKAELEDARRAALSASSQSKQEAIARAEQIRHQIESEQAKVQQQVSSEISSVKQSASEANAKIASVSTDVGTVRSEVSSTKAELDKTIADLRSVRGDMGVQSGLIATNAGELAALKLRGERNYFEFKLGKSKQPQRVGDVSIVLTRTDAKKNKYSLNVIADDKLTEKKDRGINEPVQFYTSKGGRLPYELVVNTVNKDQIVGYLSTPKETVAR